MKRLSFLFLGLGLSLACASTPAGERRASTEARAAQPSEAWLQLQRDLAALPPSESGIGSLEVPLGESITSLDLLAVKVDVQPAGHLAAFDVEHTFDNPTDETLEGTFRFTLPRGAVVTGLALEIDGEMMEGEVLARDTARKIYEDIVDQMKDPALLEWEQGETFKLRVFPIEPKSTKRVQLRYLAPTSPNPELGPDARQIVVPTFAADMQRHVGKFSMRVAGTELISRDDIQAGEVLRVPLPSSFHSSSFSYTDRAEGRFVAARVQPDWSRIADPNNSALPRRLVMVVDTSRSALEEWNLVRESVRTLSSKLSESDEVVLITSDLRATLATPTPLPGGTKSADALDAVLEQIEPDGASDLGAALDATTPFAAVAGRDVDVVYIGDGTPTWGELDPDALLGRAEKAVGAAPLHAVLLGRGVNEDLAQRMAGSRGGKVARPRSVADLGRFAAFFDHRPGLKSVREVSVDLAGFDEVHGPAAKTWFQGDEIVVSAKTSKGGALPSHALVRGIAGGEAFEQRIPLANATASTGQDKLYASRAIAAMQADKSGTADDKANRKDAIIAMSEQFGVLSRHTAFLVLESEEAYRLHDIERRRKAEREANQPNVTGRNLGGSDEATYLSPGDLQPGDPEILIPAPEDAQSVTVVFPFGETKSATWDEATGKWMVRFLVDEATPAGTYRVQIRVVHADGRVEAMQAEYHVDVRAPEVELEIRAIEDELGSFMIFAQQRIDEADRERGHIDGWSGEIDEAAASSFDAKRVEVSLPDGQTLRLRKGLPGRFVRKWTPRSDVQWPVRVELTTTDRALNVQRAAVELDAPRN